jgi:hypothetical protein
MGEVLWHMKDNCKLAHVRGAVEHDGLSRRLHTIIDDLHAFIEARRWNTTSTIPCATAEYATHLKTRKHDRHQIALFVRIQLWYPGRHCNTNISHRIHQLRVHG